MDVKDFWCRYEWQHRASPHVQGFYGSMVLPIWKLLIGQMRRNEEQLNNIFIVLFMHGILEKIHIKEIYRCFQTFFCVKYLVIILDIISKLYLYNEHMSNIFIFLQAFQNFIQHLCLKNTTQLTNMDIDNDYEQILNYVEHHIVGRVGAYLHKKQGKMVCR